MTAAKYGYDLLIRHSNTLSMEAKRIHKTEIAKLRPAFLALSKHFDWLCKQRKSHQNNVKLALHTRFANHLLAASILIERGLLLDAASCFRAATETTAFYWLVCLKPEAAGLYDGAASPRPVEIRKQLEALGVDVSRLRDRYRIESEVAHVGNKSDNLQINWDAPKSGSLLYGGGARPEIQQLMFADVQNYVLNWFSGDSDYEIEEAEDG